MSSYFVVCMGGSGSKVAESLVYLVSAGVFKECREINILIADPHISNGNVKEALGRAGEYKKLKEIFSPDENNPCLLFGVKLNMYSWDISPNARAFENNQNNVDLHDLVNLGKNANANCYARENTKNAAYLMEALYTDEEQQMTVFRNGYNACPSVGVAFCASAIEFNKGKAEVKNGYKDFCNKISTALSSNDVKLVLIGSLFGGTGASCLSALARDFRKLDKSGSNILYIAGIFLLPYYTIEAASDSENIKDDSDTKTRHITNTNLFSHSSKEALKYYHNHGLLGMPGEDKTVYNSVYLIGSEGLEKVSNKHTTDDTQKNKPHFVELDAVLMVHHFFNEDDAQKNTYLRAIKQCENSRVYDLAWSSYSETGKYNLQKSLGNFMAAGLLFTGYLFSRLFTREGTLQKTNSTFLQKTGELHGVVYDNLSPLHDYFIKYMRWCKEISETTTGKGLVESTFFNITFLENYVGYMSGDAKFSDTIFDFLKKNQDNIVVGMNLSFEDARLIFAKPAYITELNNIRNVGSYAEFLSIIYDAINKVNDANRRAG